MVVKVIQGIKPYNDIFYKTCFYNSLFSVLEWMNKSIYPHITNDIIFYNRKQEQPENLFMDYHSFREAEDIFREEGYAVDTKVSCEQVVENLIQAINQNRPVILWVDCFYENIRLDMYKKEHWAHTLLVVGYNNETKQFAIIEHTHRDSLNYEMKWISYDSLEECYYAFFELENTSTSMLTYYEFEHQSLSNKISWKDNFEKNVYKHQFLYSQGISTLVQYSDWMKEVCLDSQELQKSIEPIFASLNKIVTAKQVEFFRYSNFDRNRERMQVIGSLLEYWKKVRTSLGRYYFSSVYSQTSMSVSLAVIDTIIENEFKLLDINSRKII